MMLHEVKQLVRSIENLLLRPADVPDAELMNLADLHEQFIKSASTRLEQVDALLQKGLRTEAIELADLEPNLNDLLTALDFPELVPWNDLLQQRGMQPVRGIPVEAAAELNDSYLAVGNIDRLLQNYRSISLARAPLAKRIVALRRLAQRDPLNPVWAADLKDFELHRLKLIRDELDTAISSKDLDTIAQLDAELSNSTWSIDVPARLRDQTHSAHQTLRRQQAREELHSLSHQLSDAYSAFDLHTAFQHEKRLKVLQSILNIDDTHQLLHIAAPALDWLREERLKAQAEAAHSTAVHDIEKQLDGRSTLTELERLYHQATRFGHALPPQLQARLTERRDQLLQQQRMRRILTVATIVFVLVMAAGFVGWMIQISNFNRDVARHSQQLQQLLRAAETSSELAPLESYYRNLENNEPKLLQTPQLMARKSEFDALVASERGRSSRIRQLTASIQQTLDNQPALSELDTADNTAAELLTISRTQAEKAEHARLQRSLRTARRTVQTTIDDDFSRELEGLSDTVQQLSADNLAAYDAAITQVTALNSRPHVSANLKTLSAALLQKVHGDRQLVAEALSMASDLQQITNAIGNVQAYEQALSEFVRRHPGRDRAIQFQSLLQDELPAWQAAGQWKLLRQSLLAADLGQISSSEAALLLQRADEYAKNSGPLASELLQTSRIQALRRIQARNPDGSRSFRDQVLAIFSSRLIGRTYLVETISRGKYYCSRPPQINGKSTITVEYFITTSGTQTQTADLRFTDVPDADAKATDDAWLSPQAKLLLSIEDKLTAWSQMRFESALTALISEILAAESVDPVLRLLLLDDALRLGNQGSEFLRSRCEPLAQELSSSGVSRLVNWAIPMDARADDARFAAKRAVERIAAKLRDALAAATVELDSPAATSLPADMQWIGWLHRTPNSAWTVSFKPGFIPPTHPGRLLIFQKTQTGSLRTLVLTSIDPAARLSQTVQPPPDATQEGRPVFLELPEKTD